MHRMPHAQLTGRDTNEFGGLRVPFGAPESPDEVPARRQTGPEAHPGMQDLLAFR